MSTPADILRTLPAVQLLLDDPALKALEAAHGREAVLAASRETLAQLRAEILDGKINGADLTATCVTRTQACIEKKSASGVRRVINGTGVILHTGLGRAVLPAAAVQAIMRELTGYAAVEVDVESGKRGHRDETVRELLTMLLGCEHATVVNNNAAATMLALAAVARGKEVIVSRGQLVEIGGSFRVPDVMRESGCTLVEVGTTNRTYGRDYEAAITPQTAALMAVHTSNFRMIGFTEEPAIAELSALARKHNLPLLYDIGSGALLPDLSPALKDEPSAKQALDDGADLVLFSADKILGGPQGGIAAGKKELVEKMRRHPLFRAFRVDKLKLCALEATLRLYLDPARRDAAIPTLRAMSLPLSYLSEQAAALADRLTKAAPTLEAECRDDASRLGSGSLPERDLPTRVVALRHPKLSADDLGAKLRAHRPPIFTRIQDNRVLIDPRTLLDSDVEEIEAAVRQL